MNIQSTHRKLPAVKSTKASEAKKSDSNFSAQSAAKEAIQDQLVPSGSLLMEDRIIGAATGAAIVGLAALDFGMPTAIAPLGLGLSALVGPIAASSAARVVDDKDTGGVKGFLLGVGLAAAGATLGYHAGPMGALAGVGLGAVAGGLLLTPTSGGSSPQPHSDRFKADAISENIYRGQTLKSLTASLEVGALFVAAPATLLCSSVLGLGFAAKGVGLVAGLLGASNLIGKSGDFSLNKAEALNTHSQTYSDDEMKSLRNAVGVTTDV